MSVHHRSAVPATAEDFLLWHEGREGRREFVDGRVIEMMVGGSMARWKRGTRLSRMIGDRLNDLVHAYGTADFGVRTSAGIRYPDFLVTGADGDGRDLATERPIFIAEILSPSSIALDFGPKAAEYTALPSLRHYLVLSQDEPRVWLWDRCEDGFAEPEMIEGADAIVTLAAFDLELSLAELYRGSA